MWRSKEFGRLGDRFYDRTITVACNLGPGLPTTVDRVVREEIPADLLALQSVSVAFRRFAARARHRDGRMP